MSKYDERNIVENMTADGDYPAAGYLYHTGDFCIATYGDFGGACLGVSPSQIADTSVAGR